VSGREAWLLDGPLNVGISQQKEVTCRSKIILLFHFDISDSTTSAKYCSSYSSSNPGKS
jgi:hypothetical protein